MIVFISRKKQTGYLKFMHHTCATSSRGFLCLTVRAFVSFHALVRESEPSSRLRAKRLALANATAPSSYR